MNDFPHLSIGHLRAALGAVLSSCRCAANPKSGAQRALGGAVDRAAHLRAVAARLGPLRQSGRSGSSPSRSSLLRRVQLRLALGIDGIALMLIVLSVFLMPICIGASWNSIEKRVGEYHGRLPADGNADDRRVRAQDLFLFYIFFEAGLIPMYLIIGVWGGGGGFTPPTSSSSTRCSARC